MRLVHSVEKLKTLTSLGDPGDCVETDKPISFETLKHPLGLVAYQAVSLLEIYFWV